MLNQTNGTVNGHGMGDGSGGYAPSSVKHWTLTVLPLFQRYWSLIVEVYEHSNMRAPPGCMYDDAYPHQLVQPIGGWDLLLLIGRGGGKRRVR